MESIFGPGGLGPQTSREPGTYDYLVMRKMVDISSTTLIYDVNSVAFSELYLDKAAFDQHVANVNRSLSPLNGADNWFADLVVWRLTSSPLRVIQVDATAVTQVSCGMGTLLLCLSTRSAMPGTTTIEI